VNRGSAALLLGASSMFATMYSTQAILPELSDDLDVSAAVAGLTVSVVVLAVALGGWVHGPLSDRIGRRRVMVASAGLLVVPTALLGLSAGIVMLIALRIAQGLLMPGLLVVAVPYITERFSGAVQGRWMGAYTSSLVLGGFVGRVGTGLVTEWTSWRVALSLLAVPAAVGALAMWRWLPPDAVAPSPQPLSHALREHLRNGPLLLNAFTAGAAFFGFVGVFTYATFRLTDPPFNLSLGEAGLVYGVWLVGLLVTPITGLAGRIGPQRVVPWLLLLSISGALLTLVDSLPAIIAGLAAMALAMFTIVPACQLLIPRLAHHQRGTATSLHLTVYYAAGGLGGYLPGFALDRGWGTLVAVCTASIAGGLAASLTLRGTLAR
jgi:YNFM family putative membrane transporter